MKIFQLNLSSIFLLTLVIGLGLFVPSLIIESIWNASVATTFTERDLTINVLQALLLWGALLTSVYMSGIFKIQIDLKKIDDPELKDEIEKLKAEFKKDSKKDEDSETEL